MVNLVEAAIALSQFYVDSSDHIGALMRRCDPPCRKLRRKTIPGGSSVLV